jgi:hypothetical protein
LKGYISLATRVEEQVNQIVASRLSGFLPLKLLAKPKVRTYLLIDLSGTGLDWMFAAFVKCLILNKYSLILKPDHVSTLKQSRTFN